jgi:NAD(P)-dependent dehydrogenase (short-subunit alcohol dehydrogenase family)
VKNVRDLFAIDGRVAVITGGAGLLGFQHASAIAAAGGIPVLIDISEQHAKAAAEKLAEEYGVASSYVIADITSHDAVAAACEEVLRRHGRADILINNAANNPKLENTTETNFSRFEHFPIAQWEADIAVGLTGALLCSQRFGTFMAEAGRGVILNIASDLAVIAPDQRLYRQEGTPEHLQPVKPVTYSIVKSALVGLTRYLATYWADKGVRVNAISPGGVHNGQPDEFVSRLSKLIPMQRMASLSEYQGSVLFLCSDASSYMTGTNLIVDGGRTVW